MKVKTNNLIVGGGLSGLIMGMMFSLTNKEYVIIEKNGKTPEAKLHYLHSDLTKYFPFKLRNIEVVNNILWNNQFYNQPTVDMMNYFSYTTLGKITQNSMKFIDGKIHQGWIPEGGIENIGNIIQEHNINTPLIGFSLESINHDKNEAIISDNTGEIHQIIYDKVISTIPLPFMLKIAKIEHNIDFKTEPIKMTEIKVPDELFEELYQVVYIPQASLGYARFSILGKRIVAEKANGNFEATEGANRIGLKRLLQTMLPNCDVSKTEFDDQINFYGRYMPIKEEKRLELIRKLAALNIVCLGRYAEWSYKRVDHITVQAYELAHAI